MAGVLGAQVTLTDYEPRVVAQLAANMELNTQLLAVRIIINYDTS